LEKGFGKTSGNSENNASLGHLGMPVSFSILFSDYLPYIIKNPKRNAG